MASTVRSSIPRRASPLARRLAWYWPMEAANVILVPGLAFGLVWWRGEGPSLALGIAAVACAGLLVIGALYWRAALRRIEGRPEVMAFWLPRLGAAKPWALALVLVSGLVAGMALAPHGWPRTADGLASLALAVLALLEYVNYYVVQLQHFDNAADFRRLLSGRRPRRAHLARDLDRWRGDAGGPRGGAERFGGE